MSLVSDSQTAAGYLERLQAQLWEAGDHSRDDDIASIICMLDSPLFLQLLNLQESFQDLSHLSASQPLTEDAFDFSPSGELLLREEVSDNHTANDVSAASTLSLRPTYMGPGSAISTHSYNIEFQRSLERAAKGRQTETICLFKPENTSLGFSVVGLKDEEDEELGIYVQDIQPAGIAAKDGRLREGDQLLAIDGQPLDISHQEAIHILQSAQGPVEIVVARGPASKNPVSVAATQSPTSPTSSGDAFESQGVVGGEPGAEGVGEVGLEDGGQGQGDKSDMVLSADWTQLEVIDLINDGTGLGFGIIGGRSTGVVVKTILPGGVADLEGHLRSGDHILQIGDVNVRGMSSEQVALVLRQSGSHVRLIVARSIYEPPPFQIPNAPIIPTSQLDDHVAHINALMEQESRNVAAHAVMDDPSQQLHLHPHHSSVMEQVQVHPQPYELAGEVPEVEMFEVDLMKDTHGLGITIAGYVGGDNTPDEISGIYVKSISPGSAAAADGRIQVNDQIIEVDGQPLQGYTNHQAVEVLRNTGQMVHLRLARFRHGPKYEKLQQYLAQANQNSSAIPPTDTPAVSNPTYELDSRQVDVDDINVTAAEEDYSEELRPDVEAAIKTIWERIVGPDCEVVVAQLSKFKEGGGLGISLEGTVDVENGQEVRPHHYIGSIRPDGPVGLNGRLKTNDELLEVNGKRLLGLNHVSVVEILKYSPQHVRLVCARKKSPPQTEAFISQPASMNAAPCLPSATFVERMQMSSTGSERLIKAKSEQALSTTDSVPAAAALNKSKSRSLEPLTGLAMWSSEPVVIELEKGDRGLGFSILDYKDPMNPNETVIVIRSLVPGGVAQQDGRLVPGDRLMFVNAINLEQASLDEAAQALKGATKGIVRIGVAKPLPLSETPFRDENRTTSVAMPPTPPTTADAKSQLPRPDTSGAGLSRPKPLGGVGGKKRGPPPPVPPKPRLAVRPLQQVTGRDVPPPLPATSPPPPPPPQTAAQTSPAHLPSTPPLRPAPTSPRHGPDARIGGHVFHHRKTSSQDSSASSSSDHATLAAAGGISMASDLKGVATPPSSPGLSPMGSPRTARPGLPSELEKCISLDKGNEQLGINVETVDKGINGCVIKSIIPGGAVHKDGRLQPGDYIVSINNESLRRITNAQARAILRRTSLLSSDINITYIPGTSVPPSGSLTPQSAQHSPSHTSMPSPNSIAAGQTVSSPSDSRNSSPAHVPSPLAATTTANSSTTTASVTSQPVSPRQKSLAADGSPAVGNHAWGPPRTVELERQKGKSLGISIVGGRVDMFNVSQEHTISGIFIKHVLDDSPAKANASLKTGDRILEVNGVDVRNATHDEAVEVIRNSSSPVRFMVQSLVDSTCPVDVEGAQLKPVQSFEEAPTNQTPEPITSQPVPSVAVAQPSFDGSQSIQGDAGTDSESEDEFGYTKKRLQRKYGDLGGQIEVIEFSRGKSSIGLCLAGNKDRSVMSVFVAGIQPDSPAARDGRIRVGDELLEINGSVLHGRSHLNASALVKSVTSSDVKLIINRRPDSLEKLAVKPISMGPSLSPETEAAKLITDKENKEEAGHPTSEVVQVITLQKQGTQGLGFGIMEETRDGRHGIYIRHITIGGAAAKDGQMAVGDELLEVGDESLLGQHCDKANEILRKTQGAVRLKIRKSGVTDNNAKALGSTDSIKLNNTTGSVPVESPPDESSTDPTEEQPPVDPLTCPVVPGKETYIEIEKGRTGLGLSIVGGSDTLLGAIIIHEVYADGAAARDGRLWAGDQILEVNKEDLREATHDRAIQILRQTPQCVGILVYRDDQQAREEDLYDVFTVELIKRPGKGLGLSIVGKKNDVGIYISDIVKGGVAEADGRLMQGDQILAVNGEDMRNATQEYAAGVLKTLMGKVSMTVGRLKAGSRTSSRKNSTGLKKSDSSASNRSKGKHSKSQSEDASHLRTVQLEHDLSGSLGISVAGGLGSPLGDVPIIIANLNPDGPAARSGKLRVGDKILMINGVSTDGMGHADAVQLLKASSPVTLQVVQGEDTVVSVTGGQRSRQVSGDQSGDPTLQTVAVELEDEGQPPQKTVTLERGPDGLGFSIVGGHGSPHGDLPIYVKNVFAKGAAAENGQLARGDQILSVNGQSLDGVTHEQAVNILKNSRGKVTLVILS
ncbi:multiple PDZ domain protein-like isoform X9 [Babylonia areolata]|uniref:multiple PDZ domain protein-like isoform X9 n=1 Tax=Babylonia areolata TaxID=304850 RepID=UPI003FD49FBD